MDEKRTFTGPTNELLSELVGSDTAGSLDDEAALSVLEFFDSLGANIEFGEDSSDTLAVRLFGPVFLSVRSFVWGSAAAILGLAVAILGRDPNVLSSAAQLAGSLLTSVSVFPSDTTEFKVYSAIAALQRDDPGVSPNVADVEMWLEAEDEPVSSEELQLALDVLVDRQLLRRAGEDRVRIVW